MQAFESLRTYYGHEHANVNIWKNDQRILQASEYPTMVSFCHFRAIKMYFHTPTQIPWAQHYCKYSRGRNFVRFSRFSRILSSQWPLGRPNVVRFYGQEMILTISINHHAVRMLDITLHTYQQAKFLFSF